MPLTEYLRVIRRSWVLILICTLSCGVLSTILSLVQPTLYEADAKVFVSTTASTVTDLNQGGTFAQQAVQSYADVVTTSFVLGPVINELRLDTSVTRLARSVRVTVPQDTVILNIAVTDPSPKTSAVIANAISRSLTNGVQDLVPQTGEASAVKLTRVEPAVAPDSPISPSYRVNVGLGLLVGLLFGVLAAVIRDRLDTRIRASRDLDLLTNIPTVGRVHFDVDAQRNPLVVHSHPQNRRAEAFRALRTNLRFFDFSGGAKSLVLTSATAGEGKSTSAVNLAIALAEAGQSVALIEGDLRRPKLSSYLNLVDSVGLTDVLIGETKLEDALQKWGERKLWVLPAGALPPNPSELLGLDRMGDVVRELEAKHDIVLIDAPPLLPVTDGAILSRIAGGVLVICALGRTHRSQLLGALEALSAVRANVMGLVLTMVPARGPDSYSNGYGGYDYSAHRERDSADAAST